MKKHILIFAALFSFGFASVQAQDKISKNKLSISTEQNSIEALLNSKNFEFIANTAYPTGGTSKNLVGSDYAIIFSPKMVKSHLPFYGRAYSGMNMSKDKGMRFNGKPQDFKIENNDKGYHVQTKVEDANDTFSISISVSNSGYATLTISSNNRGTISYYGEIISAK